MFLVEQRHGRAEVQLAAGGHTAAADVIESVAVADQDAQHSAGSGCGDANRNLANDALATIGTEYGFNFHFIARPGLGNVGAGALQTSGAAVVHQIETEVHAADGGNFVRIVEDAAEAVAEGKGDEHAGGLAAIVGGKHVAQFDVGVAVDFN